MASKNTTGELERFEEEVDRLADERSTSFSAALALKAGESPRPAKEKRTTKERKPVPRKDFEDLWEQSTRNLEMLCGREFREQLDSGEVEQLAAERGVPYQDAFAQLQDEAYRPLTEAMRNRQEARQSGTGRTLEADEERVDKQARDYAERHGTSYTIALDSVIGTTPGARRAVELEETLLTVDTEDADLNRRVEARARREGVSYEIALEAVLTEGR